ncbi:MAG: heavy-metal-associated domain-containing protein, partial [Akkermansiaceae bacterium]
FIEANAVGKKASYQVKNMVCQSCANHLMSVLGKTKGVTKVDEVDFKTGKVAVTYNPDLTDETKIKAAINSTRYKVDEKVAPML